MFDLKRDALLHFLSPRERFLLRSVTVTETYDTSDLFLSSPSRSIDAKVGEILSLILLKVVPVNILLGSVP